jgi:murein DD-endopeptidase MepM/ murein hydrolase activator NlpD
MNFLRKSILCGALSIAIGSCATTNRQQTVSDSKREVLQVQVESGDTLNKIAKQFDTKWNEIVAQNKEVLRGGLRVGQILNITPGPMAVIQQPTTEEVASQEEQIEDEDEINYTPKKNGLLFGNNSGRKAIDFIYPVEGRISSKFGKRGRKFHKGIDIAVNVGTPLVAIADGEVIFSGKRRGYGGTVVIDHGSHMSLYAHCSKMIAKVGDSVKQGEYIAKSGRTGNARGAHLHFEIRDANNRPIDPLPLLRHKTVAKLEMMAKQYPELMVSLSN